MRRILRLFRRLRRGGKPDARFARAPSSTSPDPRMLVRAGEIASDAGETREALTLFGRAVDGYLEMGEPRAAERVCRLMIGLEPRVIRTRFTLAAIAVGRNQARRAGDRIRDYMNVVRASGAEAMAVSPLLDLGAATSNPEIRDSIADALRGAGRADLGEALRQGTAAPAARTSWSRAAAAATRRPSDVNVAALTA